MGTCRPHVEITAATVAGGEKNQDRYAYGDGWAFVLDGASSFTKTQPEHDGGWYAERLMQALSAGLADTPERTTPEIVEGAIRVVAEAHGGTEESCPTSTIALARWGGGVIETYSLGDSTIVLISDDKEEVFSDARLADIARPIREEYRSRLRAGCGFDEYHRQLLQDLQAQQLAGRNQAYGYWIAGAEPAAARHGLRRERPLATVDSLVLATDGAVAGLRYGVIPTWSDIPGRDLNVTLRTTRETETSDDSGVTWPRSKSHDDKTILVVKFESGPSPMQS